MLMQDLCGFLPFVAFASYLKYLALVRRLFSITAVEPYQCTILRPSLRTHQLNTSVPELHFPFCSIPNADVMRQRLGAQVGSIGFHKHHLPRQTNLENKSPCW